MYGPGTLVAEKYRVERLLGRGGMGIVVAATHLELRIPVALKFLSDRYAVRADIVQRFLREARSAAQLQSPHVCRVTDVGRLPDGVPFIVMELLVGADLAKVLRDHGPMPAWQATRHILQACDAVAEAHAAGIVHRDLKPGNLFLAQQRDGSAAIKVLDFGVAKVEAEQDHAITSNEAVMGSPSYMAPEQLRSARAADARSDIWSLGCILHQLVAGHPPFCGETIADLAIRAATEPPAPLDNVSPEFAAVVARCLEKRPDARFQTVGELADALAPLAARPSPSKEFTVPVAAADAFMAETPLVPMPPMPMGDGVHAEITTVTSPSAVSHLVSAARASAALDASSLTASETTLRGAASIMTARPRPGAARRSMVIGGVAAVAIGAVGSIWMGSGSHKSTPAPIAPVAQPATPEPAPPPPTPVPVPPTPPPPATPTAATPPPPTPPPPIVAVQSASKPSPAGHRASSAPKSRPPAPAPAPPSMKTKEEIGESRQ